MSEDRLDRHRHKRMKVSADTTSAYCQSPLTAINGTNSSSADTFLNASRQTIGQTIRQTIGQTIGQTVRPTNVCNTNNMTNSNEKNSNSVNYNTNERQEGDRDRETLYWEELLERRKQEELEWLLFTNGY